MKAAIYARVSTADQSCEMQLRELGEYASRRAWEVVARYVDTGWSGTRASRPELDRLMGASARREFDAVLVWKLDRFGRSVRNCLDGIAALQSHGVRFLAVSQSIDTDENNPTSRLMLHVLAAVAEFEREMIRERIAAGIRNARAKGKQLGRKRAVFDRAKATELRRLGHTVREIATVMNVSRTTVHRSLRGS